MTHQIVTKRLLNVPKHIDELKIVLWNRFSAVKERVGDPGVLELLGELPRDEVGNVDTFPLLTSKDLQDYVELSNSSKLCPRLRVTVGSEDSTSVSENPPLEPVVPPLQLGGPKDERMSWGLHLLTGHSHLNKPILMNQRELNLGLDDKEESKSIIDWGLPANGSGAGQLPAKFNEDDYFKEGEDPFDLSRAEVAFQE